MKEKTSIGFSLDARDAVRECLRHAEDVRAAAWKLVVMLYSVMNEELARRQQSVTRPEVAGSAADPSIF